MLWFYLSLATVFLMASNAAYMKRFFSDVTPWEMAVIPFFYSTPLCLVTLLLIDIPPIGPDFFPAMSWGLPLTMVAIILHFRAIHMSPLSLTMPFLAFTPVFVLLTGDLILGETLNLAGTFGILLVVGGGYVINIDSARHGVLGPIKAIYREPGSAIMLFVAALYGVCSVGGKVLVINSSPLFASMLLFGSYGPLMTLLLVGTAKASLKTITRKPLLGLGVGTMIFVEIICHNIAISLVAAAYMITIKRLAGIFSVIYGWFLFKESGILFRLLGTLIMTAGAVCIVLYGK